MKLRTLTLAAAVAASLGAAPAAAIGLYPWNDHAKPYNFLFGNEIDSHQQTRRGQDGDLAGHFYVAFTDVVTKDGYRVATHVDCDTAACTVGWTLKGERRAATFLYEVTPDHPVFLMDRTDIPEPGAYAHFHWLGAMPQVDQGVNGYLLELTAVDTFCFIHHGADTARKGKTCRDNGGIAVSPGIDIATHLNIVTSFQ